MFLQFIVSVIAGYENLDHKVLLAIRALTDYIFMAHNPLLSVASLETMAEHLSEFHRNKSIFIQNGSQGEMDHLRIPKLHALIHYLENSYQLGVPNNFSTETPESLHIKMCKEPYKATNHCEYDCQILNYLDIQDRLVLWALFEVTQNQPSEVCTFTTIDRSHSQSAASLLDT